jgi:hypothetical protein
MVCLGGVPPDGMLAPGAGVTLSTGIAPTDERFQEAVVLCRIGTRRHAWTAAGLHRSWTLRFPRLLPFSDAILIRRLYPNSPAVEGLTIASYTVERYDR